jgi:predicted dehydrogenase
MSERRYRVGIIGCGPRANQHAEALRTMPEVEIAGAADIDPARLEQFCSRWEIENRYGTSTALLEAQKLDLVTIVTLPGPRRALVVEAARAGVPAINAEKNMAYRMADADAMVEACRGAGALLTINHQMRFMEQFAAVRELVRSGRLGEIRFMRAGSRGHLMEQGPHVMDQLHFMNDDSAAEWVLGQADGVEGYARGHTAPSSTTASVRFANGARAVIENGMLAPEPDPNGGFWLQKFIEVTGTRGWAGAYVNNGWKAVLDSGETLSGPGAWEPNAVPQSALFRASLAWLEDRSQVHPCRAEVAARGLEALLAVAQSAIDRAAVVLPLDRGRDPLAELKPLLGPGHSITA